MALPVLNETPKFNLTIPSTGKEIKYRPYLVKEERVLLMAAETKDSEVISNAIFDTIKACTNNQVEISDLTTFDVEYLFLQLRAKSSGESANVLMKCSSCEHHNEVSIPIDEIKCSEVKKNKPIKISDSISIEMKYPNFLTMGNETFEDTSGADAGFKILHHCLKTVITGDERIDVSEESEESVRNFFESMTQEQFNKVAGFLADIPAVSYTSHFNCEKCNEDNSIELRGLQSFF